MSERKMGCHYHVKVAMSGRWAVAFYGRDINDNVGWYLPGGETFYLDSAFSEIGPRIPTPDEPWQCVPVEPTGEMTKAGTWSGNGGVSVSEEWARKTVYGRMLSAAPKPEDV